MLSTNSFPPRGISKSTSRCRFSSSITSERDCNICAAPAGHWPDSASASHQIFISTPLLRTASMPPFNRIALPDFNANDATCGTTSGRDSNTTATTPRGQDSFVRTNPSSNSVVVNRRPSGSGSLATPRTFSAMSRTLSSVTRSLASIAPDIFPPRTNLFRSLKIFLVRLSKFALRFLPGAWPRFPEFHCVLSRSAPQAFAKRLAPILPLPPHPKAAGLPVVISACLLLICPPQAPQYSRA